LLLSINGTPVKFICRRRQTLVLKLGQRLMLLLLVHSIHFVPVFVGRSRQTKRGSRLLSISGTSAKCIRRRQTLVPTLAPAVDGIAAGNLYICFSDVCRQQLTDKETII
jgi:hypothetical protein